MEWDGPILDNHLHLRASGGRGLDAVEDFVGAGGTHLIILNLPSWSTGTIVSEPDGFREGFAETVALVHDANELLPGRAWAVLGVHPGIVSQLIENANVSLEQAASLMRAGIDVAASFVADGEAIALKSGRPHYPVSEDVWDLSNSIMRYTFSRAAELGCPVQLHTEASDDLSEIAAWATAEGMEEHAVVKHYATGAVTGPIPSVIAKKGALQGIDPTKPFFMETDYLDDPTRPGAVLGPKTVPRRVDWLASEGKQHAIEMAHVTAPNLVYGIDTRETLDI